MEIFKQINYDTYALWIGDNINKHFKIPSKKDISLKIYGELSDEMKVRVEDNSDLAKVCQTFLDSGTGTMSHLVEMLREELHIEGDLTPYSYLSEIDAIKTVITHSHSEILEKIWTRGEIHNLFHEKQVKDETTNLFKILGDYTHKERIILTSQNMRRVKKLKLYNHFWNKLQMELEGKKLVLLGVGLDDHTKDVLSLVFEKVKLQNTAKYFVTSAPLSEEDKKWLVSNSFQFIYEEDEEFIKKIFLHLNKRKIVPKPIEPKVDLVEDNIESENLKEIEKDKKTNKEELKKKEKIETSESSIIEKNHEEKVEQKQLKIEELKNIEIQETPEKETKEEKIKLEQLDNAMQLELKLEKIDKKEENTNIEEDKKIKVEENTENIKKLVIEESAKEEPEEKIEEPKKEYVVEKLAIPLYLDGTTLKGEIVEEEVRNRQKRLVEFNENRYPSYKIDDFSEFNHYKALDITIPFSNEEFPKLKLDRKIFTGKVDLQCNGQTIYGVSIRSHMSEQQQVIEFKNHDFTLQLLLNNNKVVKFYYKISENTNNIKGKNIYIFFKHLFSGFELNFKNKKISGHFKILEKEVVNQLDIIIDMINKYLLIKKQAKLKAISLKDLLKNTRSLEALHSYYTDSPRITNGNITIRSYFSKDSSNIEKLSLSYPISINFLGIKKSLIETTTIKLEPSNINHKNNLLEVQSFNTVQTITYEEIKK